MDALYKLDTLFMNTRPPKVVYVLCGNFASGKSTWISNHVPILEGVSIYLDGTNHSMVLRQRIIKHIRKFKTDCKIVCVRILCDIEHCLERNANDSRVRYKNSVPKEVIDSIGKFFEEVTIDEGFDEIIIGGAHV